MTNKVRVYGKAQNRTALGIMHAYMVMYPQATMDDLKKAFPDELNPDSGVKKNFVKAGEKGTDAKRLFDECLRQEEACAPCLVIEFGVGTEDLVAQLLMVVAKETHQIGKQGDAQEDGQADEQDADDLSDAAIGFFLCFAFLGLFAFRGLVALFGFLFRLFLFFLFSINYLCLQRLGLGCGFFLEGVLFTIVFVAHFLSLL